MWEILNLVEFKNKRPTTQTIVKCVLLEERNEVILKEKTELDKSLADKRKKYKDLEARNRMILKEKMDLTESLASFKEKLDMQQRKCEDLQTTTDKLMVENKSLEGKLGKELTAKVKLSQNFDKLTRSFIER